MDNFYKQKESILKNSQSLFSSKSSYILKIGIELEFYLTNKDDSQIADSAIITNFISNLSALTSKFKIEPEQGVGQIEIKTEEANSDILQLCNDIEEIKSIAENLSKEDNLKANFGSRPYAQDCPSSLQFNISLHQENGDNVINTKDDLFKNIISTLLDNTNNLLEILAPTTQDYLRFSKEYNKKIFSLGKYTAPTNLSFGNDNRTCAIRYKPSKYGYKIEYRVASSMADPYLSFAGIIFYLAKIFDEMQFNDYEEIYGNAFDDKYDLKDIAKNKDFENSEFAIFQKSYQQY